MPVRRHGENTSQDGALAVYATVLATHVAMHPLCDHVVQNSDDAAAKGKPGGQAACARHVTTYTAVQVAALTMVTRALGLRLPWHAVAAGTAVNAVTHYVLDRRAPLRALLKILGKEKYLARATVQRREGVVDDTGPGTAFTECDQAMHHLVSVGASLLTAWLTARSRRREHPRG